MNKKWRVCVIGAGVIGLSTAVNIVENIPDAKVTVIAEKMTPNTTSDGAAGIWLPPNALNDHELGTDVNRIRKWCIETREHLGNLCRSSEAGNAGVQLLTGYHLFKTKNDSNEHMYDTELFPRYNLLSEDQSKPYSEYKYGSHFTTYLAECRRYLPWLMNRFLRHGGVLQEGKIKSLEELIGKFDIVITCVGVGAKSLLGDESMVAVRGQLIKVSAPWMKNFVRTFSSSEDASDMYIYPGVDVVSLGGTYQVNNCDEENDQGDIDRISKNVAEVVPALKNVKPLFCWTGIRPCRKNGVRLELDMVEYGKDKLPVIHNYGHGSFGIIVHWGCALEATDLVRKCLSQLRLTSRL
ncbi:D-aspartate oxidase-like isoform X2 [Ptychodera flava]